MTWKADMFDWKACYSTDGISLDLFYRLATLIYDGRVLLFDYGVCEAVEF